MTDTARPGAKRPPKRAPRRPLDPWREFVTPEGVDLRLRIGEAGERAGAFLVDGLIIIAILVGFTLASIAAFAVAGRESGEMVFVIWLLGAFALRNFYFMGFELRPGAATPGKRLLGLRVIARGGGRLTAEAVFARNAMRELEVFLPMTFLFSQGEGVDGLLILLGIVWSGVFLLFPLFNRDRLRLGDLVAGTMVVKAPKRLLQPDLAGERPAWSDGIVFSPAQVDAYGVKELHVLEEVLRRSDRRTMAAVAQRIRKKIDWTGPADVPDAAFLRAYYAGLRRRLESRMLFGHRRKDKFDRP